MCNQSISNYYSNYSIVPYTQAHLQDPRTASGFNLIQ